MTNPDNAGVLPELPAFGIDTANHASVRIRGYTADQMRAYGKACVAEYLRLQWKGELCRAAPAGGDSSREAAMVVIARGDDGVPTVWCDPEIVDLVAALNTAGIRTVASCSGHGERHGNIALADGRELIIAPDFATARRIDETSAPAGGVRVDGEMFICYLIDKCERETISEESLHEWLADFLKNQRYHRPSAPAGSGEVSTGITSMVIALVESARAEGGHRELRSSSDETVAYWTARTAELAAALLRKLQQSEDDGWKADMFDSRMKFAQELGYAGIAEALEDLERLRKLQQGADYVVVPREASEGMWEVFDEYNGDHRMSFRSWSEAWRAMVEQAELEAAASQGQEGGHVE